MRSASARARSRSGTATSTRTEALTPRIGKILAWGVGILVAVTLAIILLVPDFEVVIPEDEVRDRIEDAIPVSSGSEEIEISVTKAAIDFRDTGEKGQVALFGEVRLAGFGLAATGEVDTVTAIRYEDGAFYLSDLRLDDLTLTPTLATRAKIAAIKKAWQPLIDEFVKELETSDSEMSFEEVKAEFQRNLIPLVRQEMDKALGTIPVYRLQGDAAQGAARLILKDISFTDREAVAVLSPAQAMIKIATAILGGLILLLLGWEWLRAQREAGREPGDS